MSDGLDGNTAHPGGVRSLMRSVFIGVVLVAVVAGCTPPETSLPPRAPEPSTAAGLSETVPTADGNRDVVGPASGDALGPFFSLLGVGAVVDATVVDELGPEVVLNEFGSVDLVGRSENPDDWTTANGLPVVVLDDVEIVEQIGGSDKADRVVPRIERELSAGRPVELLAPVGVFETGRRYQFWVSASQIDDLKTYLVFTDDGEFVPGLGMPDPAGEFGIVERYTGLSRQSSLALMALEMNANSEGAPQGELMDLAFGATSPD